MESKIRFKYSFEGSDSSHQNKIKEVLSLYNSIVLVQKHELERLLVKKTLSRHDIHYINLQFNHYILNGGDKTYNTTH